MMEAAAWVAALHIDAEGFADAIDTALVGVTGNAVRIFADKDGVAVLVIPKFFAAFIERSSTDKGADYFSVQKPVLEQISIHPAHIPTGRRQGKVLLLFLFLLWSGGIDRSLLTAQQTGDGFRIGQIVELLDERDRPAALFCGMIVPTVSANGDTVVAGKPLFEAGGQQLLALPDQKLLQINLTGSLFLFVSKMDIWKFRHLPAILFSERR